MANLVQRKNISSGSAWEPLVGYSRAVRIGNRVEVSGTTAGNGNTVEGIGDVYAQARISLQKISAALQEAGAGLQDVIRTRIYVININQWEAVARAHREIFGSILPACSMLQVSAFIDPRILVEIEASAEIVAINQDNDSSAAPTRNTSSNVL